MAVKKSLDPVETLKEILIVRREVIGRVPIGDGPGSAVEEAFKIIGVFFSDNDNPTTLEFSIPGARFTATLEYSEPVTVEKKEDW